MQRIANGFLSVGVSGKCNEKLGVKCIKLNDTYFLLEGNIADGYGFHRISSRILSEANEEYSVIETLACREIYKEDASGYKNVSPIDFPIVTYTYLQAAHEDLYVEVLKEANRTMVEVYPRYQSVLELCRTMVKELIEENKKDLIRFDDRLVNCLRNYEELRKGRLFELAYLVAKV